jgi:transmembrane sensor
MPVFQTRLAELTYKYLAEDISDEEHEELMARINNSAEERRLFEEMTSPEWLPTEIDQLSNVDDATRWNELLDRGLLDQATTRWWQYVAIAAILLVVAGLSYLYFSNNAPGADPNIAGKRSNRNIDSLTRHNKALLKLATHRQILLDTAMDGQLLNDNSFGIEKRGDELIYTAGITSWLPGKHEVQTNRGKGYKVTLSDGSQVWLNAQSIIKFPPVFAGNERMIDISGEAYFEIAKDSLRPFKVRTQNTTVEVLGTKFNVNAYADEPSVRTTLLEGSVRILAGSTNRKLTEGQQIAVAENGEMGPTRPVDVRKVVAWKLGIYHFANDDIETILRQVERWYNVEVTYAGRVPKTRYAGMFSNATPVEELIPQLNKLTGLHLDLKKNVITVNP